MHPIEVLLSEPFGQALGWTLVHFVWQGGVVALLLAVALRILHRHAAPVRYAVACGALLLLLVLPMITLGLLWPTSAEAPVVTAAAIPALSSQGEAVPEAGAVVPLETSASWQQAAYATLGAALPWLVLIWMTGVLALSMRYLAGWTYTLHLRRRGTREVGQRWQEQRARLAQQLGVTRPVRIFASALVHVPMVAGWLRPVILMPVSVFTGLTPRQVEMIIAHELAHIRRHDYLVNLLQAMCETLLFYHPAVWWVSQRIRVEREHCCDDLVVAVCGDAFTYAEALTKMEQVRQTVPRLALAATGGSLIDRVRRLLEGPTEAAPGAARWLIGLVLVAVLLLSLPLSSALDGLWHKTHGWIAGAETEETLDAGSEGRLFIHTRDERGVLIESFRDGEARPVVLKGPQVTVEMPANARLVVDDLNGPSPKGKIDFEENTITFSGDLELEIWQGEKRLSRLVVREATVVYAMPKDGQALARNDERPRQHPLLRRGYGDTALRLERLIFDDPSLLVQMEALEELRKLPKRTSLPPLVNLAEHHPRQRVRNEAVKWLGRIGDAYVVYAVERIAFEDRSFSVQREALHALRHLPQKLGLPSLMKIAQVHPRAAMRSEAVQWLGRIDGDAARLLLERILFEDADLSVQTEAFDALETLTDNLWTFHQIAETHPHAAIRRKANQWLSRKMAQQQSLMEKQRQQRSRAFQLRRYSGAYQNTAEKLERLVFEDQDPAVQREAFDALLKLPGPSIKASLTRIIETHPDPTLCQKATDRLETIHQEETVADRMGAALETNKILLQKGRRQHDWVFDLLRSSMGYQNTAEKLERLVFEDQDPAVQREAFDALQNLPGLSIKASLTRIVETHPDATMRQKATDRLKKVDQETAFTEKMLLAFVTSQSDPLAKRRVEAVETLKTWPAAAKVYTLLIDIAFNDPSLEVQREALDALRERGGLEDMARIARIARKHPNPTMRIRAVRSMDDMTADDRLPLLEEIIFLDENIEVRMAALDRLKNAPLKDATEFEMAVRALKKITENHANEKIRNLAREAVTIDAIKRTWESIKNMYRDQ